MTQQISFARIQSPSSINTFKQCPRKYYYSYIEELETLPSIHLVRGKIAHSALEDFFKININEISEENYKLEMQIILIDLFYQHWTKRLKQLEETNLTKPQLEFYFDETKAMLKNWLKNFFKKLNEEEKKIGLVKAFEKLKPETEVWFKDEKHGVQGFIDAIHRFGKKIVLVDYKTSKKDFISEEYKLQLAIYALLYYEKHGVLPNKVGIDFLKHGEKHLDVDEQLLQFAKKEIEFVHMNTQSKDIVDYPKQESGLCNWGSGCCDFYEVCKNSN